MIAFDDGVGEELFRQASQVCGREIAPQKIEIAHLDLFDVVEPQLSDLRDQVGDPAIGHVGLPEDFDAVFHASPCLS